MQPRSKRNRVQGFTLIEIMVVVAILGILAAIITPRIMDRPSKARVTAAKQDIRVIESALNMYKLDNYNYPSTEQGLEALVEKPDGDPPAPNWQKGGYLDKVPKDPWGREYKYLQPGQHGEVDVYTLGADGKKGGEGPNRDLGNWNVD